VRRWRPTRYGVRRTATLVAALAVFTVTSTQLASAADGSASGILGPFDVTSSERVPLDHYELVSNPGGVTDFQQEAQSYLMGCLFSLVRIVVGLECWLIHWAYSFPLVQSVSTQSQQLADDYRAYVVDALGLPGLLLAWAVVVCSIMLLRGKAGKALGELALTFAIVAVAASALVRPDVILGSGGLLDQTHQASLEVAAITTSHGAAPPASVDPATVSTPIEKTLTDTFVVQPYQLLQFGRLIPASDKAYPAYKTAVTIGPFNTTAHADPSSGCVPLPGPGGDAYCKAGAPSKPNCSGLVGTGRDVCEAGNGSATGNVRSYTDLANGFSKVDPAIAAYVVTPSWDRVFGALLLLIAALIVGLMVLAMVLALFAAQFADAVLASCGYGALVWATLPGPSRTVLWRWVGSFVSSTLVMFAAAVFLPLFDVGVAAFLQGAGPGLVPRLAMIDLLAVAGLGFHRRLLAAAASTGARVANRLRWARIGGAGSSDDAFRTGQVIAGALGSGGLSGPLSGAGGTRLLGFGGQGGSPQHAHLVRRARLLSSVHALGDAPGAPLHPGRLVGDAARQARHALAPATTVVRGGHHLWKGKALSPEELERRTIKPGMGGRLPVGSRLHNRLIQTRGGRTLLGTGRLAWNAGPGLPATWTRTRRRAEAVRRDARGQYQHYRLEGSNYWHTEWKPGFKDLATPATAAGHTAVHAGQRLAAVPVVADTARRAAATATAAGQSAAHAGQRLRAAGPAAADTARRAAATTATAAVLSRGPSATPSAPGPVRAAHSASQSATNAERARAEILHALARAQREARGESDGPA
jgi:hypothetical protein